MKMKSNLFAIAHMSNYKREMVLLINSTISDVSIKEDLGYKAIEAVVDRYIETEFNWDNIPNIGAL